MVNRVKKDWISDKEKGVLITCVHACVRERVRGMQFPL